MLKFGGGRRTRISLISQIANERWCSLCQHGSLCVHDGIRSGRRGNPRHGFRLENFPRVDYRKSVSAQCWDAASRVNLPSQI